MEQRSLVASLAVIWLVAAGCGTTNSPAPQPFVPPAQGAFVAPPTATFSVVAFDPDSGELGVAVQSKYFGVGTVVPWARAKVGAIATQSYANVAYGEQGLALLQTGKTAGEVVRELTGADSGRELRQLGIVDAQGRSACFTGSKCNPWAGHREGRNYCVQGNLLTGEEVIREMAAAFENARKVPGSELGDWLMAALEGGQAAGGDKRGQQSAALLVVREKGGVGGVNDRYIDLRVEDHSQPIRELARLLGIHKKFYASAHNRLKRKEPAN